VRPEPPLKVLEAFVDSVIRDWSAPGAAAGVMKNGEVPFARGFGFRDLNRNPDTNRAEAFQKMQVQGLRSTISC